MNLTALRNQLISFVEIIERQGTVKSQGAGTVEIPVEILLAEESIGPVATTGIKLAALGFDWNAGKILIVPEEDLIRKSAGGFTD